MGSAVKQGQVSIAVALLAVAQPVVLDGDCVVGEGVVHHKASLDARHRIEKR